MLGTDLMRVLASAHEVIGVDLEEVDITDPLAVEERVAALAPDVLINAAAYTDVDKSEREEDVAFRVNAGGSANLALALTTQLSHRASVPRAQIAALAERGGG